MKLFLIFLVLFCGAQASKLDPVLTLVLEFIGRVGAVELRLVGRAWRDAHDTILRSDVKRLLAEKQLALDITHLSTQALFMLRELKYIRGSGDWEIVVGEYLQWAEQSGWRGFGDEEAVEKRRLALQEVVYYRHMKTCKN